MHARRNWLNLQKKQSNHKRQDKHFVSIVTITCLVNEKLVSFIQSSMGRRVEKSHPWHMRRWCTWCLDDCLSNTTLLFTKESMQKLVLRLYHYIARWSRWSLARCYMVQNSELSLCDRIGDKRGGGINTGKLNKSTIWIEINFLKSYFHRNR